MAGEPGAGVKPEQLPERYVQMPLYQVLRVCERFGVAPWSITSSHVDQHLLSVLVAFDRVRTMEQQRESARGI